MLAKERVPVLMVGAGGAGLSRPSCCASRGLARCWSSSGPMFPGNHGPGTSISAPRKFPRAGIGTTAQCGRKPRVAGLSHGNTGLAGTRGTPGCRCGNSQRGPCGDPYPRAPSSHSCHIREKHLNRHWVSCVRPCGKAVAEMWAGLDPLVRGGGSALAVTVRKASLQVVATSRFRQRSRSPSIGT